MKAKLKQMERFVRATRKWMFRQNPPYPDVNHLLHHLRGEAFGKVPQGVQHLVSVGCSGTWYFDWIEKTYGPVQRHTGVEFYSPKPADLPHYVEWIANTAGNMPEIASQSADGMFSGQNLEHLWPEDVCGFYLESHRILRPEGLLVVDSPNRLLTARLNWSHPEHTVELTPREAVRMTELAGFRVTCVRGLWLCEDPASGALLPFAAMNRFGDWPMRERMRTGWDHPDSSFIWWVEARRENREPDEPAMKRLMQTIWDNAWPQRCRRMQTAIASAHDPADCYRSRGRAGVLMYGPYMPLRRGEYDVEFSVRFLASAPALRRVTCEVVAGDGSKVLARRELDSVTCDPCETVRVQLSLALADTLFGVQFRVIAHDGCPIEVARDVQLTCAGSW